MYQVECNKCGGKGIISCYKHIVGGVCFSCNGKGYTVQKAKPTMSNKYCIGATSSDTKEIVKQIFWINAKSESQALASAIKRLNKSKGYIADTAFVSEKLTKETRKFKKVGEKNAV